MMKKLKSGKLIFLDERKNQKPAGCGLKGIVFANKKQHFCPLVA